MSFPAAKLSCVSWFRAWTTHLVPRRPLFWFSRAFAAIWLTYDLIDISLGGTRSLLPPGAGADRSEMLALVQTALVLVQAGWLVGFHSRVMILLAAVFRGHEITLYALNDFRYFIVVCVILAVSECENRGESRIPGWPRDVLVFQTAWIYLASGVLKLNPAFLSGGDLYVRQNYLLAAFHWPYPEFYRAAISGLRLNAAVSWLGASVEIATGVLLFVWLAKPTHRKTVRCVAFFLVTGIHVFAAAALNVFWFGAALITQVALITWEPRT